jgi:IS5 family transposase
MTAEDRHGTDSWYRNHGCRCDPCRHAHTEHQRQLRQNRRDAEPRPAWQHGSLGGYINHGCRCVECRRAHSDYQHTYRGYKTWRRGESMPSDFPGLGVLRCVICDRPYVEHAVTESCR